jgi:hypothetical protein
MTIPRFIRSSLFIPILSKAIPVSLYIFLNEIGFTPFNCEKTNPVPFLLLRIKSSLYKSFVIGIFLESFVFKGRIQAASAIKT